MAFYILYIIGANRTYLLIAGAMLLFPFHMKTRTFY